MFANDAGLAFFRRVIQFLRRRWQINLLFDDIIIFAAAAARAVFGIFPFRARRVNLRKGLGELVEIAWKFGTYNADGLRTSERLLFFFWSRHFDFGARDIRVKAGPWARGDFESLFKNRRACAEDCFVCEERLVFHFETHVRKHILVVEGFF